VLLGGASLIVESEHLLGLREQVINKPAGGKNAPMEKFSTI
jgi:hypothetical protein